MRTLLRNAAAAVAEIQLHHLNPGGPLDDAQQIADEMLDFIDGAVPLVKKPVHGTLKNLHDQGLPAMTLAAREQALLQLWNQPNQRAQLAPILQLGWLVILSRPAARQLVGFRDPTQFPDPSTGAPAAAVIRNAPPEPPLDLTYDVCIVGSGAGGSVVAALTAEAGKSVLIVEEGDWISPHEYPTRDDMALRKMFRQAGVYPALDPDITDVVADVLCNGLPTVLNVLQARVVGGGPTVNNAIMLPIPQRIWTEWRNRHQFPIEWQALSDSMDAAAQDLGAQAADQVGPAGTCEAVGQRSEVFRQGFGAGIGSLEVFVDCCIGCGGCNMGCRFGRKTGGLHGPRAAGRPVSYLERALDAGAVIRPNTEARRFAMPPGPGGDGRVRVLEARLLDSGGEVSIKAKAFVLAAGPIASSQLLQRSQVPWQLVPGTGISANIVTAVIAVMPQQMVAPPDPGLEMCFYVGTEGALLLESWFHYPASLAVALPQWIPDHATVMRQYSHLVACGVVVPSGRNGSLGVVTDLAFEVKDDELARLKQGIEDAARLYIAAGATRVLMSSREPIEIRPQTLDQDLRHFHDTVREPRDLNLATAHPQGGNPMGVRPRNSVVGPDFRVHGVENLFVADTSLFPDNCGANPQLTTMGLARLAAASVLEKLNA